MRFAIDIETGAFKIADKPIATVDQLYERDPNDQTWVIRIGHRKFTALIFKV
jgi:hypothetical protein